MRAVTTEEAHRAARDRGVSGPLYTLVRGILNPLMRVWFRIRISGRELIPAEGAAILAPNHKSFYDSFFLALATPRHLRFMGKVELFEGWRGPLLVRLGAFPVRRGHADADALETARSLLSAGELLAIFPEGTRVRDPASLGSPRRGAGRLALESGASLVPAAITGTENLFAGPFPKPRRVQVAFAEPIPVVDIASSQEEAGRLVEEVLWPEVQSQFGRPPRPSGHRRGRARRGGRGRRAGAAAAEGERRPPRRAPGRADVARPPALASGPGSPRGAPEEGAPPAAALGSRAPAPSPLAI